MERDAAATGPDPGKEYRARAGIPVVPAMDGFRALAVLGIVLVHLIITTSSLALDRGNVLVWGTLPHLIDVLFILSGFVLFLPTVAKGGDFGSPRAYAIRRAARVLPVYWTGLFVVLVMVLLWPVASGPSVPSLKSFAVHLGIMQMPAKLFDNHFIIGFTIASPVWTLSIELIFYALLPFVAGIYFKHPLLGLAAAAVVTIGWKVGLNSFGGTPEAGADRPIVQGVAESQFPAWVYSFGIGMTGAWAYVKLKARLDPALLRRRAAVAQVASLITLAICAYLLGRVALDVIGFDRHVVARRDVLLSLAFTTSLGVFMVATALAPPRLQALFSLPAARSFADNSFGIYMIHVPLILLIGALLARWGEPLGLVGVTDALGPFLTILLTAVPLTLLYGWASARYLEQPIRRWAHGYGRRAEAERKPVPGPGEPATPVER